MQMFGEIPFSLHVFSLAWEAWNERALRQLLCQVRRYKVERVLAERYAAEVWEEE